MIAILRSALIFLSLLLISLCQATEDGNLEIKERTHTTSMTIALDIVAEIQGMKPSKKSALQQSPLDVLNESYTRTDWPGLCVMSSLVKAIQVSPEVIKEFKDKLDEIRDHELFHVEENWTLEYLDGQVSASLSDGK